jgi:hypothetical protein
MRGWWGVSFLCGVWSIVLPREVRADEGATLMVEAAADTRCPSEASLREAVARRIGRDPFTESSERAVEVHVEHREGTYRARIELMRAGVHEGQREVVARASDCDALTEATALSLALVLEPAQLFVARRAPPSPLLPRWIVADDVVRPSPAPASEPWRARPRLARFRAALGVLGAFGASPHPTMGSSLLLGVRFGRWFSANLEARADLPAESGGAERVRSSLVLGGLCPCAHVGWFTACGLGALGALLGQGVGAQTVRHDESLFAALGGRGGIEAPIGGPLALRVHADLLFPVTPTALQLDGHEVWRTPPVSGALGLGLGAEFP